MTNEEVERNISFLLENQARHDAQIAELREMVIKTNRAVWMMAESGAELDAMLTRAVTDLTESQQQTQAQLRETQAQLRETSAQSRDTDARLNALIKVVERMAGGA